MYYIDNKVTNIVSIYENIDDLLKNLNIMLSDIYDFTKQIIIVEKVCDKIVYKTNDILITTNIVPLKLDYLPYFVLHKDIISKYDINSITNGSLLNIFTSKKCITDPYKVLLKIFNISEELIFQTFILFLNKTISDNHKTIQLNLTDIFENFFIDKNIDYSKYNRLFTYFISAKKIYPFTIQYNKYISMYDL